MGGSLPFYHWLYKELFGAAADETASYRFVENGSDEDEFKPADIGDFVSWQAMVTAQQRDQTTQY